ncbi:MAG: Hsp20/alpha crystallin family protein [Planctomycetota bacterium]
MYEIQSIPKCPRPILTPAVDIQETRQGLLMHADLPGVSPEFLELGVEDNVLKIFGKVTFTVPADMKAVHEEVPLGDYARVFILSDEFDTSGIRAEFDDGVLTLFVPKARPRGPRRIEVSRN